jgi:uncharacterized coiled-coil protein SlyX
MINPMRLTNAIQSLRNFEDRSPGRPGFLLIAFASSALALSPSARAVDPPPDGGYPNQNTAEGQDALFHLTTGFGNTAIGFDALFTDTTGQNNTAIGFDALFLNTTGFFNTATGAGALLNNTAGAYNTANGEGALYFNTTGNDNTATGTFALTNNTTGSTNTANGRDALLSNTTGSGNTANGDSALRNNETGSKNIALGSEAGVNLTRGSHNIYIGNQGMKRESNALRIGMTGSQTTTFIAGISGTIVAGGISVVVDTDGHLGTVVCSQRFKEQIQPMDKASEAILALKPVTFRYKHELDPDSIPQFGLVAEQVEKVSPDLVARDESGKPYTVRYEAVNAMLLNEFLKEHHKVETQEATIGELKSMVAQQRKDFQALTASVKKQASQIQKVSDQLEVSRLAPRVVADSQ